MNEKINNLMVYAIDSIKESGISDHNHNVSHEYKGYISSLGASIRQAGLLPTLAFYSRKVEIGPDKRKVLKAIMHILNKENNSQGNKLLKYVIETAKKPESTGNTYSIRDLDFDKLAAVEEKINNALIALKLAFRTYKIKSD